jgi:hypothetical protein
MLLLSQSFGSLRNHAVAASLFSNRGPSVTPSLIMQADSATTPSAVSQASERWPTATSKSQPPQQLELPILQQPYCFS